MRSQNPAKHLPHFKNFPNKFAQELHLRNTWKDIYSICSDPVLMIFVTLIIILCNGEVLK